MLEFYILDPFNFMLGFALREDEKCFTVFIGLCAISYSWGDGLC
jgi:hypothetical protein